MVAQPVAQPVVQPANTVQAALVGARRIGMKTPVSHSHRLVLVKARCSTAVHNNTLRTYIKAYHGGYGPKPKFLVMP